MPLNHRVRSASESVEECVLDFKIWKSDGSLQLQLQLISRAMMNWLGGEDGGPPPNVFGYYCYYVGVR
jgi:hypothetical protein